MARTPNQTEVTQHISTDEDTQGLPTMADAWNEIAVMEHEANQNAIAVARQLGYDGTLSVGALEDEIRFYQRRSVEACIELGKRLLVLKELTPHGEFQQRIELLGIGYQTGKKFMAATMKFSKGYSNTLLAAGTQTKMLELLVLDDGEIEALESGESVRGVTLDKIETMSVSELKKALRDANERIEAKDSVIKDKSAKIDDQAETIAKLATKKQKADAEPVSVDQALIDARNNLQITAIAIKMDVMSRLTRQTSELLALDKNQRDYVAGLIIEIKNELDIVIGDFGIPTVLGEENLVPEWMRGTEFDPNKQD
jgi:hypothetical protein